MLCAAQFLWRVDLEQPVYSQPSERASRQERHQWEEELNRVEAINKPHLDEKARFAALLAEISKNGGRVVSNDQAPVKLYDDENPYWHVSIIYDDGRVAQ